VVKRRSVHAVAMLVFGAGEKLPCPILVSRPFGGVLTLESGRWRKVSLQVVCR